MVRTAVQRGAQLPLQTGQAASVLYTKHALVHLLSVQPWRTMFQEQAPSLQATGPL